MLVQLVTVSVLMASKADYIDDDTRHAVRAKHGACMQLCVTGIVLQSSKSRWVVSCLPGSLVQNMKASITGHVTYGAGISPCFRPPSPALLENTKPDGSHTARTHSWCIGTQGCKA